MVGYQVMTEEVVIATHKLYHPFQLGNFKSSEVEVSCKQIYGHISNDNKQVNILTGQCSCSVRYPMSCCIVSKHNLGVASEWIQWKLLRKSIALVEWVVSLSTSISLSVYLAFDNFIPLELSKSTLEHIANYAGCKITPDPPQRTGRLSIQKTSDQ